MFQNRFLRLEIFLFLGTLRCNFTQVFFFLIYSRRRLQTTDVAFRFTKVTYHLHVFMYAWNVLTYSCLVIGTISLITISWRSVSWMKSTDIAFLPLERLFKINGVGKRLRCNEARFIHEACWPEKSIGPFFQT